MKPQPRALTPAVAHLVLVRRIVIMRIGKSLAIIIGVFTVWPVIYMALFITWFIVTALTFFQHTQQHQPAGPPALFQYIFLPHLLTMLLTFALIAFYIVHVFKN